MTAYPDTETLNRYMSLFFDVFTQARYKSMETDETVSQLMDVVHNAPLLLKKWPFLDEDLLIKDLEKYESIYTDDEPLFSSILKGEDGEVVEGLTLIEKAIQIAVHAHVTQKDKAGAPYILHPLRLMMKLDSENEKITAVLHDIVEDTPYSIDTLKKFVFPDECLKAIDCLSRKENESYEEFIERVKENPLAKKVKIADLEDNMDMSRISEVTEKDKKRLAKYQKAHKLLLDS